MAVSTAWAGPGTFRNDLLATECLGKTPRAGRGRLAMRGAMSGGAADSDVLGRSQPVNFSRRQFEEGCDRLDDRKGLGIRK